VIFMQERWLSVEEIAVHLGVNPDTIYKWITRKKMPAHKLGRLWKFLASEVDQWVKAGRAGQMSSRTRPGPPANASRQHIDSTTVSEENKHDGHRARLRERFISGELASRSDEALLELLLAYSDDVFELLHSHIRRSPTVSKERAEVWLQYVSICLVPFERGNGPLAEISRAAFSLNWCCITAPVSL